MADQISSSGTGLTWTVADGSLTGTRTANAGSLTIHGDDFGSSVLLVRMRIRISDVSASGTTAMMFAAGSGFTTGASHPSNATTHSDFSINFTDGSPDTFRFRDHDNSTNLGTTADGTDAIATGQWIDVWWGINNSGASLGYLRPDGSTAELQDDRWDLWAEIDGTWLQIGNNPANANNSGDSLDDFKITFTSGRATVSFDSIILSDTIASVPEPSVVAASVHGLAFLLLGRRRHGAGRIKLGKTAPAKKMDGRLAVSMLSPQPMKALVLLPLAATSAFAADLPRIPSKPIAVKKELLISEDFEKAELAKPWHKVVATFAVENGALKGTQTRDTLIPAANGKPEVRPHAAVHGLEIPTKDSVVEARIKFEGATMIDVEFDDRAYKGSHYGHLSRAQVRLDGVTIMDERDGNQNEELKVMKADPSKKAEAARIIAAHQVKFPVKLETGKWYDLAVETVGDEMRVSIDGKGVAFFKSPGIGHETKSKIEFGVAGKDGFFDDVKVWNAAPAKTR